MAIGLTYDQMIALNPCHIRRDAVIEVLGGAKAWNGRVVTAKEAVEAGRGSQAPGDCRVRTPLSSSAWDNATDEAKAFHVADGLAQMVASAAAPSTSGEPR
jgi:hypothetical protein